MGQTAGGDAATDLGIEVSRALVRPLQLQVRSVGGAIRVNDWQIDFATVPEEEGCQVRFPVQARASGYPRNGPLSRYHLPRQTREGQQAPPPHAGTTDGDVVLDLRVLATVEA